MTEPELDLDDLDVTQLTVTAVRDSAALPESGASNISCVGSCSCSCCFEDPDPV